LAAPDKLLILYEDFDDGRFSHIGRYGAGNQFMAYTTYASPKHYHTEESTPDGQMIWRLHTNCFAILHRFDSDGHHLGTDIERLEGIEDSEVRDQAKFEAIIDKLGQVEFCDIQVKPFRIEIGKIVHGLIYECEFWEEDGEEHEWVMLEPNDIMFHPPWDSGEYST